MSTALIASVKRPDLVSSMVHYEPVDDSVLDGDPDIGKSQEPFFALWPPVDAALAAGDLETAVERLPELIFSLEPGDHVTEREGILEIARQNARTLPLDLSSEDRGDTKLTCDYVSRVSVPSVYVAGSETDAYFRAMTERFAECAPDARLEILDGETHRGPLDAVDRGRSKMTRINARLDEASAADLELIRRRTNATTLTEALKYSLHEVASRLRDEANEGGEMRAFLDSEYVACGAGREDLSENYKDLLEVDPVPSRSYSRPRADSRAAYSNSRDRSIRTPFRAPIVTAWTSAGVDSSA